jgi:hypothetical protein
MFGCVRRFVVVWHEQIDDVGALTVDAQQYAVARRDLLVGADSKSHKNDNSAVFKVC